MDDTTIRRAMAGDETAARKCTEAGYALPCPFCGGKAMLHHSKKTDCFSVLCAGCTDACAVRLQLKDCMHSALGYARSENILTVWNTRVPLQPVIDQGWIPCSDRLPENDDFVLVYHDDDYSIAFYRKDVDGWDCPDVGWLEPPYTARPTHWMPLPQPPEEPDHA